MSLSKIPWFLLVVFSLAFGLMSIEYTFYLYSDSSTYTNILNDLTSWLVSHDYAFGPGSVHFYQTEFFKLNRFSLSLHTIFAGLALMIGVFQFSSFIRKKYLNVHKIIGKFYFVFMAFSLIGAASYLLSTEFTKSFSGIFFQWTLWGLFSFTAMSALLSIWALKKRDIDRHIAWIAFNYTMMITAPLLRILWITLPHFWEVDVWKINTALNMSFFNLIIIYTFFWSRSQINIKKLISKTGNNFSKLGLGLSIIWTVVGSLYLINNPAIIHGLSNYTIGAMILSAILMIYSFLFSFKLKTGNLWNNPILAIIYSFLFSLVVIPVILLTFENHKSLLTTYTLYWIYPILACWIISFVLSGYYNYRKNSVESFAWGFMSIMLAAIPITFMFNYLSFSFLYSPKDALLTTMTLAPGSNIFFAYWYTLRKK